MGFSRRNFLQQSGLALCALGMSQTGRVQPSWAAPVTDRAKVLASSTHRKLALLVGIDRYANSKNLNGCVTDVELQRELLIHRFGFQDSDILVLTDGNAKREDMEAAFVEHLLEQAKKDDVVLFHFSGYGSYVNTSPEEGLLEKAATSWQKSLLPADEIFPTKGKAAGNDFLLETLLLLGRSLSTSQVTMVLDTSHVRVSQELQGTLRSRSSPQAPADRPNPQEIGFQEQLKSRSNLLERLSQSPQFAGVVLTAAQNNQVATEAAWDGFSAGLFTYALTQYLWQMMPASTLYFSLTQTAETLKPLTSQKPGLTYPRQLKSPRPIYGVGPEIPMGAAGVVLDVEENGTSARLHLGGIPPLVWRYYQPNSRFRVVSGVDTSYPVQLRSREGLQGQARLVQAREEFVLAVGQPVQEAIRVLPRNVGLVVALDNRLERIERVDATSAFSNIDAVANTVVAGDRGADCLFSKVGTQPQLISAGENPSNPTPGDLGASGYELFSPGYVPIANTAGEDGEAVKLAVSRLLPKLETLLAAKLWRLLLNQNSSQLAVEAQLSRVDVKKTVPVMMRLTGGRDSQALKKTTSERDRSLTQLHIGDRIQFELKNSSDRPIYAMLVGLDANGNAIAFYSPKSDPSANKFTLSTPEIAPGNTQVIPNPETALPWSVSGPQGLFELYLIVSHGPFTKTLAAISAVPYSKSEGDRLLDLRNPLAVSRSLLEDLHQASQVDPTVYSGSSDVYALDVRAWASLSFIYEVV
ncbi:MAG: caspase family protein [Jaaginema sp. PMC 1079.18]|nr:caspase family protein [Jaaginema sp. PMC 1080.18]MEC4850859.1 caspase family protein [Jaaginema sp. PMC 1079.18]MEC4866269.1 caspase family protein [Jaaginema sp. PMC 1078.18]